MPPSSCGPHDPVAGSTGGSDTGPQRCTRHGSAPAAKLRARFGCAPATAPSALQGLVDLVDRKAYTFEGPNGDAVVEGPVPDSMAPDVERYRSKLVEAVRRCARRELTRARAGLSCRVTNGNATPGSSWLCDGGFAWAFIQARSCRLPHLVRELVSAGQSARPRAVEFACWRTSGRMSTRRKCPGPSICILHLNGRPIGLKTPCASQVGC